MSLHLEFEPHSWYMGAAIRKSDGVGIFKGMTAWKGYYLNGMTGFIVDFEAATLKDLKRKIKAYRSK